jgi:chromosome segregation protein
LRIRSLEISGFKSFADRVVLGFPQGICAIVGPNGCGKSNISDAIRWVMGEQNPRHLRGRTMEDLIFAGSETKTPVGMVEVVLTLDNSDGTAPAEYGDFGEIQVARRLYRGGESEYLINKVPCRLRDIVDFFLDTGVGTRGYTIVEQGHVSDLVSTRPQDRRFIIEEAAGIGKYRQRRRETERKLEATESNLVRVNDILGELRRQIGMLERQSRKAHRHRELSSRIRELELSLAAEDFQGEESELAEVREELGRLRGRSGELDSALAESEERLSEARERRTTLEEEVRSSGERLYQLRSEIQTLEGRIEYERREREEMISLTERRTEEIAELRGQADQHRTEEETARRERSEIELRVTHQEGDVARQEQELQGLSSGLNDLHGQREALGRRLLDLSAQGATLESRAESAAERRGDLERRLRGHEDQLEAGAVEVQSTHQEEQAAEARLAEILAQREALGRDLGTLLGRRKSAGARLSDLRGELERAVDGVQRLGARLEVLEEAERDAQREASAALERLPEPDRHRIRGLLADILEVGEGFEKAAEAALGSRLQGLVVDSAEDALTLLERLRSSEGGRATFLSVAPVDETTESGFVPLGRPLLDCVDAKPPYRGLLARALRDVYVVDDLGEAIERYGLEGAPACFVTRDGDVLDRVGALTGGIAAPPGAVSRPAEIRRGRVDLAELEQRQADLQSAQRVALEEERALERDLENTRSRYHSAELAVVEHEKDLERARERRKAAIESREVSLTGKAQVLDEIGRVEEEIGALRARAEETGTEREGVSREVATVADSIAERAREVERVERTLVQGQVELASLRERRDQMETAYRRIRSALEEAEDWIRRREEEARAARERIREFEEASAEASAKLARSLEEEERLRTRQDEVRVAFETSARDLEGLEEEFRSRTQERDGLRDRITAAELRAQERRLATERTAERIRERYGVDLQTYQVPAEHREAPADQRREEAEQVRRRLDSLGPVHLGAIEEYEEVSERFRYLTEQKADIEASVERLRNAIARINRTSRARFRETFERVDAEFRRTFPRLFRGGRAYLSLTEGEDVLEAGIEIHAQPPGKKLQNINLLSGGEKSLTALSLLFAVFQVKPSPFFLLDEVDAALDDVNVGRFDEMMREVAKGSQFILITHNKSTIEVADTLYGVTMEEPGASKIVSVALS